MLHADVYVTQPPQFVQRGLEDASDAGGAQQLVRRVRHRVSTGVEDLHDPLPYGGRIHAESHEYPQADAVAFAHEPEQEVLGADALVAERERLLLGQLHDVLRSWREVRDSRRPRAADA